ncbi:MAG TPA: ATP-binding protein [Bacteroidales bacterium]|nr:ATP-binding protein [Bacteroidales bacterium]
MKKGNRSFENNSFERIVTVSLLLAFVLVLVTGILSFVKLNGIISTIDDTIRPNRSINLIKDIYNDLMQAENHVKSYNLTSSPEDLDRYNGLINTTAEKVKNLKGLVKTEEVFAPYADTMEVLTEKKFNGLDMLVIIKETYPVKEAIQDFMYDFSGKILSPGMADSADSKAFEQMAEKIRKTTKEALAAEYTRNELEQEWTTYDRVITDKLRAMISGLDQQAAKYVKEHTDRVEKEASKVRFIILVFGIASAILLILAGTVIFLYIRRNNEYRKILKKAREDAEALAQARQQFLANMSHEIRTPMNIISGYLDQILKMPLEPELNAQLGIVRKSSDYLLELLNNLLDLSRIQAGKMELIHTEFNPAEITREMHHWFSRAAEEKNLKFMAEIDPKVSLKLVGDPVRLRQILFNLISNAIKYTDKGSVTLTVRSEPSDADTFRAVFEVTDTGAGIAQDEMERIFSEFTRGAVALGKSEGSGLGLNITSKLVELMDGKLEVTSTPGKGSTFRVEIPFGLATGSSEPAPSGYLPDPARLKGMNILVADDDTYNRSLLLMILDKYHCRVIECSNGQEAIQAAHDNDPDLVILDMRMPGKSGPDAAIEMNRIFAGRGKTVPIIALSAAITEEDRERLKPAGITHWMAKPFEEQRLISAILDLTRPSREVCRVDLEALRKSCEGNVAFFKEMVYLFLENTQTGLKEMEEKIDNGSWDDAAAIAHRISASCRHLRADKLYSLLKEAEEHSVEGKKKFLKEIVSKAKEEFERIQKSILSEPEFKTP